MGEREAGVWNIIEETGVEIWGWLTGTRELEFYFLIFFLCVLFYLANAERNGKV